MATTSDTAATIMNTALDLAHSQGWRNVTLAAIAAQAGLTPPQVCAEFASKEAILAGFARRIDAAVLKEPLDTNGTVRDQIFDLIMRRFDALTPYRAGIRAILHDTVGDPFAALAGLCAVHRAMVLTLEAAGVSASGPLGLLRTKALSVLYLRTLYDWLQTADDGNDDRIMAGLDKALTRAERITTAFAGQRERLAARRHARRAARRRTSDVDAPVAGAADAPEQA